MIILIVKVGIAKELSSKVIIGKEERGKGSLEERGKRRLFFEKWWEVKLDKPGWYRFWRTLKARERNMLPFCSQTLGNHCRFLKIDCRREIL